MSKPKPLLPVMLALAALAAGCGSSTQTSSSTSSTTSSGTPTTTTTAAGLAGPKVTKLPGTAGRKGSLETLAKLPRLHPRTVRPHLTGFTGATLSDKLTSYAGDVANLWNLEFSRFGPTQLPPASVAIIDQTPAACGSTQIATNSPPQYCPTTTTVELPVGTLTAQVAPLGDAALLLVVADLYGYHVENALGMLNSLTPLQLASTDSCLAGVYFDWASSNKDLQPSDETSVNKLLALQGAPATSAPGSGHLSASDLTAAFNRGIMGNGDYRVCVPQSP